MALVWAAAVEGYGAVLMKPGAADRTGAGGVGTYQVTPPQMVVAEETPLVPATSASLHMGARRPLREQRQNGTPDRLPDKQPSPAQRANFVRVICGLGIWAATSEASASRTCAPWPRLRDVSGRLGCARALLRTSAWELSPMAVWFVARTSTGAYCGLLR